MASPQGHLDERSPNQGPRSPRRDRGRDRDGDRDGPRRDGGDKYRPERRDRQEKERPSPPPAPVRTEAEKQAAAKAEYEKLLNMRSGGVYIPPARLRALQAQITDQTSKEYQRMSWEALKKSINGLINKVNVSNIKHIVPELFSENLIRGRGLFCVSILKAQSASLPFTPIYAAMAAIVNTKLPNVGELLAKRLVLRFRKAFRRNDKAVCLSSTTFIAHLANQQVVHVMLAAQILLLLLQKPTDDSVEIAVGLTREVGQFLEEMNPAIAMAVFDQFRNILHEADIDKRVQYMIEVLFQTRKDKFKDNPAIKEELDLVEEEDQITHQIELDGDIDPQDGLNIFKYDEHWVENEEAYKKLKAGILGEGSDDEDDEDGDDESSEEEEDEEEKAIQIKDVSNADLVNLRRTLYLTLMSSADPEEAVHKLMKISLPPGQEPELVSMIVESCAQEKTYLKFYGLAGERFAKINRIWLDLFEQSFVKYYDMIHRYETNRLRNIARFWGHMLGTDAIGWHVLSVIHLNEEETSSASRIFIKILFNDILENLGMAKMQARLKDEAIQPSLQGLFPHDNPRNIRFSINYFTSIGMGALTEEMREFLQNMPKPALPAPPAADDSDSESASSYSSYSSSSYSSRSRSRSPPPRRAVERRRSVSKSPPRRDRGGSYRRDRSPARSVTPRRSPSPPSRRAARRDSYSASLPHVGRGRRDASFSRSRSRSRSPSASPPRRAHRARSASESASPSPPPRRRRNSSSSGEALDRRRPHRSASPDPPRRRRRPSPTPSPDPPPRRRRDSFSVSPPRKRRYSSSSQSRASSLRRSRLRSVSRSPPARMEARGQAQNGRRYEDGMSRRGRADSRSASGAGVKRRYSGSRSRSPAPVKRGRRDS